MITTTQVSRQFGVARSKTLYWNEKGILDAAVLALEGHAGAIWTFAYGPEQIRLIRIVAELRRRGISFHDIRKVLPKLRKPEARYAVTNFDRKFQWCSDAQAAVMAGLKARTAFWVIDTEPPVYGRKVKGAGV